ncbi:Similar to Vegetative incompatibility protein HET-E-1; acc. no. Q00808 [Pyronema omphalodes CBS 100304]|uniref:Similar to Vegetative incompatibility protein HET-E-1 acc. no. Q00808 n=1 Tax=Pyronema omphalodes (strain CBS 100304) TaxID=1076935 RepID=U4KVV8_PYROM|nr:Similar to Vegetative incompatibility protein HET-E-1; acc. no. Q00808 [Pyronema omphalodes CBS 100304]
MFECLAKIKSKRRQPDLTGTLKLLSKALQKLRKTYICIDALDEFKADYVVSILRALKSLLDDPNLTTSLSVFITSRPHVDPLIKAHLTNRAPASRLSVTIKADANDIEKYLIDKIESDTSHVDMDSDLENDIVANITSTADGMFLLAALQIKAVLEQTTVRERRNALYTAPYSIYSAFEDTINRIRQYPLTPRSQQGMSVLKWVFLSHRPLKMEELRHALSIHANY